jgi:hypothetical protein
VERVTLIGGFWLGIPVLQLTAGLLLAGSAAFAVVTLPVELNASRQAVRWLEQGGIVTDTELPGIRRVLRAAAFTLRGRDRLPPRPPAVRVPRCCDGRRLTPSRVVTAGEISVRAAGAVATGRRRRR